MTTAMARADLSVIKARQRKTWASGDYAVVASRIVLASELLADAVGLKAGWEVLDVACGNGNAALAAARSGTHALGIDYIPALLEGGRARAVAEGLDVEFRLGDIEDLPVEDGSFDAVLSVFGAMFAPDHQRAADEIIRAARPGGTIGLASWTPDGFIGQMFGVIVRRGGRRYPIRAAHLHLAIYLPRGVRGVLPPLVRARPEGIRGARRQRSRRVGRRPGPPRPPLGPEPRRQHRHPRDLPGNRPHPPLMHVIGPQITDVPEGKPNDHHINRPGHRAESGAGRLPARWCARIGRLRV